MTPETSSANTPQPGRRGFGMGTVVLVALVSAVLGAGLFWLLAHPGSTQGPGSRAEASHADAGTPPVAQERWHCAMHPSIIQDHPGTCPICGMKLVKMQRTAASGANKPGERKPLSYRSPMDPRKTSLVPTKDEMGMDFIPVYADEAGVAEASAGGLATVDIDPARQQLIGLKTAEVTRGGVGGTWRTTGRIAVDETRVRRINVKVSGFVEKLFVDFTGKEVRKGQPLFSLYSPELYAAQEEYLLALKTRSTLAQGGSLTRNGDELLASARRKLDLWDIPASEIQRLEQTGEVTKTLTLFSPISGVVVKKDVVQGMRLEAGAMPYEIVDLTEVWVLADVYESELRNVKLGMPATLSLKAFPNRLFKGRVVFVAPLLDASTRTVKVRITFPNPSGELRPEMFGEVTLGGSTREGLRIPADAVINSGTRNIAFVSLGEGRFQPREVKLGESDGSQVEVVEGLGEGEQVITRANFLIDSESRLRASLAAMESGGEGSSAPEHPPVSTEHGGHPSP